VIGQKKQQAESCFCDQSQTAHCAEIYANAPYVDIALYDFI